MFEQEWTPSDQDRKAYELAQRYHAEAEAYDRTVCTGPIIDGGIMPNGYDEFAKVSQHAVKLYAEIMAEAERHGIGRKEMQRAIGKAS